MSIVSLGKFTPIGMRVKVTEPDALVINTCGQNDTAERGTFDPANASGSWTWCNPTNRAIVHQYEDVTAVSVEALWQGTKLLPGMTRPNPDVLNGDWRKGKGKRPVGAYAGPDKPLITSPGEARRRIYVPAFKRLVEHWLLDETVAAWVRAARAWKGPVYLRDHDTGRGIDRNGPMSHAWVLAVWLNTGVWPS